MSTTAGLAAARKKKTPKGITRPADTEQSER